jgi:hypothetical protein
MVIGEKTLYCALRYHQRTFNLAGIIPELDPAAEAQLTTLETQLGEKLPASVREWYSLKNGADLIVGNQDHVQTIAELRLANLHEQRDNWGDTWLYMPDDMLLIIVENQGVCLWTVQLNGSDDPPVYSRVNEDNQTWQLCDVTFSQFVFNRLWDWLHWEQMLWHTAPPLAHNTLRLLREHFFKHPSSCVFTDTYVYRFQRETQCIQIRVNLELGNSLWRLRADSNANLAQLLDNLKTIASHRTRWTQPNTYLLDVVAALEKQLAERLRDNDSA